MESRLISSLRNTKVGLNKDHVRRRAAAELSHGTPSVDPGGNSLNINHEQLIDTSRCPLFDRVPETLACCLACAAVRHGEHDGNA